MYERADDLSKQAFCKHYMHGERSRKIKKTQATYVRLTLPSFMCIHANYYGMEIIKNNKNNAMFVCNTYINLNRKKKRSLLQYKREQRKQKKQTERKLIALYYIYNEYSPSLSLSLSEYGLLV
jgi:hypothetical protein